MTTYSPFELDPICIDLKNTSYSLGLDIQANQNDTLTLNFICRNNGIEEDMSKYKVELRVHNNNANVDYIQTQNENVTLGADGSVKIVCQSKNGNKLTAYSGQCNGVLRIFNAENKQKATRIITMRIISDPLETDRANICESTITKLEDLDWILNEAYNIEDEFKKAIQEAIKQKAELTTKISESVTAKNNLNSTIQTANNTNNTLNATNTTAINTKNELNNLNTTANNTKSNLDKSNTTALGTNKTLTDTNTTAINTNSTLNTTINNANKSKTDLDTSKNNADKSKSALDGSVTTGNTLKTNLDNSISTGTTLKNDIDNRLITGNKLKTDIDNSSTIATTKKEQLDSANVQATKNIETLNSFGDASQLTKDVTTLKTKVLENTYTKIETDSTLTKLESCKDSFVHNMLLKGRTLQNLIGNMQNPTNSIIEGTKWIIKGQSGTTNDSRVGFSYGTLNPNTTYTIVLEIEKNDYPPSDSALKFNLNNYDVENYGFIRIMGGQTGRIIKTVKTYSVSNTGAYIEIIKSTHDITVSNIMILEGDWTGKEIPPYFEGIKSTGELEGNKISILSHSKNLFDMTNIFPNVDRKEDIQGGIYLSKDEGDADNLVIIDNKIKCGKSNQPYRGCYFYFKLNPNTKYIISFDIENDIGVQARFMDDTGERYIQKNTSSVSYSFITNSLGVNSLRIESQVMGYFYLKNIQIEDGTKATAYESYKSDKTEILTGTEPLMGLPNEVSDVVNFDKNEITRNIGKVVLNGSSNEGWGLLNNSKAKTMLFAMPNIKDMSVVQNINTIVNAITDKFISLSANEAWNLDAGEGICQDTQSRTVRINIYRNKLETQDVAGFKKWLQANPTTVCYQLAEPIVEKLDIKDTLQTFQDGYIQLENAITPCTSLEYSTNIPSAIGGLTQITDKLVDDVTNVEITISDLDAEIGEARKDKNTLNERLEDDKSNILKKFNDYGKKDGTLQRNLNAEMLTGITQDKLMKSYPLNSVNIDTLYLENYIVNISENDVTKYGTKPSSSWISITNTCGQHFIRQTASTCNSGKDNPRMWMRTKYFESKSMWSEWEELATTEKFEVSTQNQWVGAWTTISDRVIFCEKNGLTTHVGAILSAGISTTDTVVAQFPNVARDKWLYVLCEDKSIAKFYLGLDGKLYAKYDIKQGLIYNFDFSYRSN